MLSPTCCLPHAVSHILTPSINESTSKRKLTMSGNSDRLQGSREERSYQYKSKDLESAETYFERQSQPAWRDDAGASDSRSSGRQLMLENGPVSAPSPSYLEQRSGFRQGNTYEDARNSYRSSQPRYETRPPSSFTQERLPSRDSRSRYERTSRPSDDHRRSSYSILQVRPIYETLPRLSRNDGRSSYRDVQPKYERPTPLLEHERYTRDRTCRDTPPARQETLEEIEARYRREDDLIINGPSGRRPPYNSSTYRTESQYSSRR